MAHGYPDWGEYAPQINITKSMDVNELAARMGSTSIFDRSGTILFSDDFSTGSNRWFKVTDGNTRIYPTYDKTFLGGYSLAFYDDGSAGFPPYMYVNVPFITKTNIGIEACFNIRSDYATCNVEFEIVYNQYIYEYWLVYEKETKQLSIRGYGGIWEVIADNIDMDTGFVTWFTLKLVIDPLNETYIKAKINNQIFNIYGHVPYKASYFAPDRLSSHVGLGITNTTPCTNYLGFVNITQNE